MATTAIGTLIPILSDAGEMRTRFGTYLLGAGAIGEFGPILLVTLILSTGHPLHEAVILVIFIVLAVLTGLVAVRSAWRGWPLVERTFETSQPARRPARGGARLRLVALAAQLGLDLLLGGFVAGMITRIALRGREVERLRLEAERGRVRPADPVLLRHQRHGLRSRRAHLERIGALLKVPMFVGLFLVVRGVPALLLYRRRAQPSRPVGARRLLATELPLVVAITTLAIDAGHMKTLDRRRTGRRRNRLDADLPAARQRGSGAAASPRPGRLEAPATA